MDKYMPLGAVKVTIQKFYRISGESTQGKGVTPDVVLPSRLDGLESGEKYLDNALSWDRIASVKYQRWKNSTKNISDMKQLSEARIKQDADFQGIISAADNARKRREESLQSLLLKDISAERDQLRDDGGKISLHGSMAVNDDDKKMQSLDEEIAADPYVEEGETLLLELISPSS
jgi:carboxyl-terminal processing protease